MSPKRATLFALAWTVALLVLAIQLVRADLPYAINIESTSYTLKVEFATESSKGEISNFELEEFHSDWQRRSRVNYKIEGPAAGLLSRRGSLFASDEHVFMVDSGRALYDQNKCTRIKRAQVDEALQLDQIVALLGEPRADYELGTTRLLLGLARNSLSFKPRVMGTVNFVQDLLSKDVFEAKIGELSITTLYYGATSLPLGLPSEVLIERDDGFTMLVRYKQVTPLAHNELVLSDSSLPALRKAGRQGGASEILFDVFAIDKNFNCPVSSESRQDERAKGPPRNPIERALQEPALKYRFSFEARVESENLGPSNRMMVMYEPHLDTLRVDQLFENRATHTLVSYPHDRSYHVMRRLGKASDRILDYVLQTDGESDDISCVVSRVSTVSSPRILYHNTHSLGAMLVGAARNAIYLGLTQVRGIEAHAFKAYNDEQLPVWLEQPTVYSRRGAPGKSQWRTSSLDDTRPLNVTTIFYFARDDENDPSGENMILGNRLLHIEISKKTKMGFPRGSLNISIYDFSWQLRGEAPSGGGRTEDFLSLADYCLAPSSEDNHYARIDFNLGVAPEETNSNEAANWLEEPIKRNLALIRAVHEQFRVPSTLVFDVESRHTKADLARRESLAVTMLAAQRYEAPVTLTYLYRAKNILSRFEGQFYTVAVSGFQECFLLAAHKRKKRIVFAYYTLGSKCHIPESELIGADSLERMFDLNEGWLEIFEVSHRADRKLMHDDQITKLENLQAHLDKSQRLALESPEVAGAAAAKRKLLFSIESSQVQHLNEKIAYELDEHHLDDINKFAGLGLVAGDKQNKLIEQQWVLEPAQSETGNGSAHEVTRRQVSMTYEQCQEACLLDLECRAYSTCLVQGQLECILTSVDFTISTVVLELMELQERLAKLGQAFPVTLGGASETQLELIHVKRHPACELHNKLYKRLFKDSGKFIVSLNERSLHPATHSEQCAEICFATTLDTMRNETQRLQSVSEQKLTQDFSAALAKHELTTHCAAYMYLDKQQAADNKLTISPNQIVGKNTDGATRGYCLFDEGAKKMAATALLAAIAKGQTVQLSKFELDFSVLYEKRYGVSLLNTKKSDEERDAFVEIVHRQNASPVNLMRMGAFLDRLGNTGVLMGLAPGQSAWDCARMCFTQTSPTWPACRSFDLIDWTPRLATTRSSMCVFNSLTASQLEAAGKTDMILQENRQNWLHTLAGDEVHVWHFEPRDGLAASSLEQVYRVARVEAKVLSSRNRKSSSSSHLQVGSLVLIFTLIVVMSLGLIMGIHLNANGSKLLNRLNLGVKHRHSEDKEILVSENSLPVVTFEDALQAERTAPSGGENEYL